MTLSNGDTLTFDASNGRVTVVKKNGNTYDIASYNNAHVSHRRGAFTIGDMSYFTLSKRTTAHVLKFFYPADSLAYLEKYGYIAH